MWSPLRSPRVQDAADLRGKSTPSVVTRNGRPAAMLVNYDEYRRQRDTLDILSDPDLMKQIRQSRRFYVTHTKGLSFEDVFGSARTLRSARCCSAS